MLVILTHSQLYIGSKYKQFWWIPKDRTSEMLQGLWHRIFYPLPYSLNNEYADLSSSYYSIVMRRSHSINYWYKIPHIPHKKC